jgi:hypothetical protein
VLSARSHWAKVVVTRSSSPMALRIRIRLRQIARGLPSPTSPTAA